MRLFIAGNTIQYNELLQNSIIVNILNDYNNHLTRDNSGYNYE